MRILVIIIALCGLVGSAVAGPWPREKGQTFLSFGTTLTTPTDGIGTDLTSLHSLYVERGLAHDLTFGLDVSGTSIDSYSATSFLRLPVLKNSEKNRFSIQIGAGMTTDAGTNDFMIHTGASWGRGFDTAFGSAWATADAQVNYLFGSEQIIAKTDLTIGLKPKDRLKLMLQIQAGDYPNADPYARLAPSIAWEIRPGRHLEIGTQIGLINDDRIGARLGTWLEF